MGRTERLFIRMTPGELERLHEWATDNGLDLSNAARLLILRAHRAQFGSRKAFKTREEGSTVAK